MHWSSDGLKMLKIVQNQESQRADSQSNGRSQEDRGEPFSPASHKSSRIQSPEASIKSPTFTESATNKSSIYNQNHSPMSLYSDAIASKKNNRLYAAENRFSPDGHSDRVPSSTFTPNSNHRSRTPSSEQDRKVIMSPPPHGVDQPLYIQTDTRDQKSLSEMEGLVSTTEPTERKPNQRPPANREPEKAMQVNSPSSTSGKFIKDGVYGTSFYWFYFYFLFFSVSQTNLFCVRCSEYSVCHELFEKLMLLLFIASQIFLCSHLFLLS